MAVGKINVPSALLEYRHSTMSLSPSSDCSIIIPTPVAYRGVSSLATPAIGNGVIDLKFWSNPLYLVIQWVAPGSFCVCTEHFSSPLESVSCCNYFSIGCSFCTRPLWRLWHEALEVFILMLAVENGCSHIFSSS